MQKLLREIAVPTAIIVGIFGIYYLAFHFGYVPDTLVGYVMMACMMVVGIIICVVRSIFWKETSWDQAIELAVFFSMSVFFIIGAPFGFYCFLSSLFSKKTNYPLCLGLGAITGFLGICWFRWVDPWIELHFKWEKILCPACKKKKLKFVSEPTGDVNGGGSAGYTFVYRCFDCGWKGYLNEDKVN